MRKQFIDILNNMGLDYFTDYALANGYKGKLTFTKYADYIRKTQGKFAFQDHVEDYYFMLTLKA